MKNEQRPQNRHQLKRKRGGQKGNQNARKHGFYSGILRLTEIGEFWNITTLERVDPEIAVLRLKLKSLLRYDPDNRRVFREASRLLAKWLGAKYQLDRTDSNYLKMVIESILERYQCANPLADQPTDTKQL